MNVLKDIAFFATVIIMSLVICLALGYWVAG